MKKRFTLLLSVFAILLYLGGCDKGSLKSNTAPDTKIALESINLNGQFRLNSVVALSWFGTDIDGYITGYDISFDAQNWTYTEKLDSTFRFSIPAGSDTIDITFYVRAIDDNGNTDPTPASLRIPLKNSIPTGTFDEANLPGDTALAVTTYRWFGSDPDGDETIVEAEMRWNNGNWYSIDPYQALITFVADTNGTGTAQVFYANDKNAQPTSIDGLNLNADNILYLRVKDIAGATSIIDTASEVFIKKPNANFLVICGQPNSVSEIYRPILNDIGQAYDFIDFAKTNGQNKPINQPKFWSPTFRHMLMLYKKAFIYTDATLYNNPASGQSALLLAFMGQGVQQFTDAGRKVLVSTQFSNNAAIDMSSVNGIYPIDGIVTSGGQVRISNDSTIYPVVAGSQYISLKPKNILIGLYPIVKSADAEDFYRAKLTKLSGWQGDNLVGVRRKFNGNVSHVFFGLGLYQFNKTTADLKDLMEEILVNDFNW